MLTLTLLALTDDVFVQSSFQFTARQPLTRDAPDSRLRLQQFLLRLVRQQREVRPDVALVLVRQSQRVRNAQQKKHIRRAEILVPTLPEERAVRDVSCIRGVTAELVMPVVADHIKIILRREPLADGIETR